MSGAARSHKAISETAHCQPAADIAFESFSQNDHGPMQLGDKSSLALILALPFLSRRPADVSFQPGAWLEPQHHTVSATDRVSHVVGRIQCYSQAHASGVHRTSQLHAVAPGTPDALRQYAQRRAVAV